jgi:hypothetical protein
MCVIRSGWRLANPTHLDKFLPFERGQIEEIQIFRDITRRDATAKTETSVVARQTRDTRTMHLHTDDKRQTTTTRLVNLCPMRR